MSKYLKFYSKSKVGKELSNFSDLQVVLDGRLYKTGEHCFHGSKYFEVASLYKDGVKRKDKLLAYAKTFEGEDSIYETAKDAKSAGGKSKLPLNKKEIELWNKQSIIVQKKINRYKYDTYPIIKEILDKYPDHIFMHQENRAKESTIWGARIDKDTKELIGQNKLGILWQELRDEMKNPSVKSTSSSPKSSVSPVEIDGKNYIKDSSGKLYDYEKFIETGEMVEVKKKKKRKIKLKKPSAPPEEPAAPPEEPAAPPEEPAAPPEEPAAPPEEPAAPPEEPASPEEPNPSPQDPIIIEDDVPLENVEVVTKVKKPESKQKINIYSKQIITKKIGLHISEIGNNLTQLIEQKIKKEYENICIKEGYVKDKSINLITYSSGLVNSEYIMFVVSFECLIFKPVEGMNIYNCVVQNISRAGIKCETNEEISPAIIFIAKDHSFDSDYFNSIIENDNINIKVIGYRYELKDTKVSIIASLIEK